MAAKQSTAVAPARPKPLAQTATHTLVSEYDRQLKGFGWRQPIFDLFRKLAHFLDTHLDLPTIIHHDKNGDFIINRCGTFDNPFLAERAIEAMKKEAIAKGRGHVYFEWADLPHNGVYPVEPGRYGDSDFPDLGTDVFRKANRTVRCPVNGQPCNPNEGVMREVSRQASQLHATAESLSRQI